MALSIEMILTLQQVKGFGNKTIKKIADHVSVSLSSIEELCRILQGFKEKKFKAVTCEILDDANRKALNIIAKCQSECVGIMSIYEQEYPDILRSCTDEKGKLDPPIILYYRGDLEALKKPGIAVIGTRKPTANGIIAGKYFAAELAKRGYNIVSGLAVGCDTAAHQGALDATGITTAIVANGLDFNSIYPKENLELAKEIVAHGGILLSEYPVGIKCDAYKLVARDRLQAGLSIATVVIQIGESVGTFHAVNATINSEKLLFVVEFKRNEDLSNEVVLGNVKLLEASKAKPINSKNIEEVVSLLENFQKKANITSHQLPLF